jgi:hypothetical protein
MWTRRLLVGMCVLVVLGAGFVFFIRQMTPETGITWDNFRRLRAGMHQSHVEAILGESFLKEDPCSCPLFFPPGYSMCWGNKEDGLIVGLLFDREGYLRFGSAVDWPGDICLDTHVEALQPKFLDRLRWLLW